MQQEASCLLLHVRMCCCVSVGNNISSGVVSCLQTSYSAQNGQQNHTGMFLYLIQVKAVIFANISTNFFFSFLRAPHHVRPYWHCQCHAQCHRKSSWILGMCPSRLFYRSYNEIIAVQPTSPTTHGEHNYLRYFLQKGSNVINLSLLLQHIWTCTVTGDGRQCRQVVQDGGQPPRGLGHLPIFLHSVSLRLRAFCQTASGGWSSMLRVHCSH